MEGRREGVFRKWDRFVWRRDRRRAEELSNVTRSPFVELGASGSMLRFVSGGLGPWLHALASTETPKGYWTFPGEEERLLKKQRKKAVVSSTRTRVMIARMYARWIMRREIRGFCPRIPAFLPGAFSEKKYTNTSFSYRAKSRLPFLWPLSDEIPGGFTGIRLSSPQKWSYSNEEWGIEARGMFFMLFICLSLSLSRGEGGNFTSSMFYDLQGLETLCSLDTIRRKKRKESLYDKRISTFWNA